MCVVVLSKPAGNAECVKLVIAKGASLEAYDLYSGTPLHVACANQHLECVKVLLNAGRNKKLCQKSRPSPYSLHPTSHNELIFLLQCIVGFQVH